MTSNEQGLLKTAAWKWITRLLLIAISVTMLFPLLWNLYSSFKTNTEFLADAFTLPSHLEWDNYVRAFENRICWTISGTRCLSSASAWLCSCCA